MLFTTNGTALAGTYGVGAGDATARSIGGQILEAGRYADYNVNHDLYFFRGTPRKRGKRIVGDDGNPIEFRGIGTHAPLQYTNLHTLEMMRSLRAYGVNLIRISVYLEDYTFLHSDGQKAYGYLNKPDETKAEIERIVNYCGQLGMYVLLDWHIYSWGAGYGTGIFHQTEAEEFFSYFCQLYQDCPYVMYEVANEPHHTTSAETAPYVKDMYDLIRSYIPDAIVVTGTCKDDVQTWYAALLDAGADDIFISPHAYGYGISASRYAAWWDAGIPLFNSEWGNSEGSGDGKREDAGATELMKYYHAEKIPQSVWKLTDQAMTTAVLKNLGTINSSTYAEGFDAADLSPAGTLYFTWFRYYGLGGN